MLGLFRQRKAAPTRLGIHNANIEVEVSPGQTLLQAALDRNINFPHSCRVGGCGGCKSKLLRGKVKELTDKTYVLDETELAAGFILACQSVPKTDVVIDVDLTALPTSLAGVHTGARIAGLRHLNHDILELVLETKEPLPYRAGQYAELVFPAVTDEPRLYSFATPPATTPPARLVFHVRLVPGGAVTPWLHGRATLGDPVSVGGPLGEFGLRPGEAPLLCVAGGSGLAPILAMLEQAAYEGERRDVVLLFGARTERDLYGLAIIEEIRHRWRGKLEFLPLLSAEPEDSAWPGRRGLVTDAFGDLPLPVTSYHAYLCGPPAMVDAGCQRLAAAGVTDVVFDKFLDQSHTAGAGPGAAA